jgi:hypothetical protein
LISLRCLAAPRHSAQSISAQTQKEDLAKDCSHQKKPNKIDSPASKIESPASSYKMPQEILHCANAWAEKNGAQTVRQPLARK